LMSIGEENMQGNDVTKEAFKLLKASGLNFRGNIEGHDLFEKPAEVVVCDGFTGNVVLKTTEAVAHAILSWLKLELFKESGSQARRKARRRCIQVNSEKDQL
jgi:glycerol-3-phosphate acyltransferase PlsX